MQGTLEYRLRVLFLCLLVVLALCCASEGDKEVRSAYGIAIEDMIGDLPDQVTHNLSPSLGVVLHNTLFPETFAWR